MKNPDASPFPANAKIAPLRFLSYSKLKSGDVGESQRLFEAAIEDGFFYLDLRGDASDYSLLENVDEAFELAQQFFSQDLNNVKRAFKLTAGNIGYMPLGSIKDSNGNPSNTEICSISQDCILGTTDPPSPVPQVLVQQNALLRSLLNQLYPIASFLLQQLARDLELPEQAFTGVHQREVPSTSVLRFLHYPPMSPHASNRLGLRGHSDSNSLTFLFTRVGGLQVLPVRADQHDDAAWQWVEPEPGCAIVNLGDTLTQWTGGVLRSAYHRVVPGPGAHAELDRYSFGYFLKPADDTPMMRFQAGTVIPKLKDEDLNSQKDRNMGYLAWHKQKTSFEFAGGHVPRNTTGAFFTKDAC